MDADTFLTTIFDGAQGAVITVNAEDGFQARRWKPGKRLAGTVYFCISTVRDPRPRDAVLSRQTHDLLATYVIVLDDVGTKVSRERLAKLLPSTYRLETSAGNEQWGYILDEGCEPARAAALIEALAAAGLTDMGARRADRIMRLPGSVNVPKGNFIAQLLEWAPERVYSFTDICVGLGVTPSDTPPLRERPQLPDGMVDPLFVWLQEHGHVLDGPNPRGWWPVRCPQEHLHSGEIDHGTDYLPGMPGVFKCQHGHCTGLGRSWLSDWVQAQDPGADLSVMPRAALEGLGRRLAGALGVAPPAGDSIGPEKGKNSPGEVFALLQRQAAAGSMFGAPAEPLATAPMPDTDDPQRILAWAFASINLRPEVLPDPDRTQGGLVAVNQKVTAVRVHAVMDLIGMKVRENVMTGGIECRFGAGDEEGGYFSEDKSQVAIEGLLHACVRCGMSGRGAIYEIVALRAAEHRYSPVGEWICSKPWDGRSRIRNLCESVVMRAATHNRWRDVAIRRWLIQTVRAIRNWEPCEDGEGPTDVGCMLVLQGEQGQNKSRWVESLMPKPWVTIGVSLRLDTHERDAVMRATRTPITELGELDGSFRRSDVSALKAFLTSPVDIYRKAYARHETVRPRCTSFAATVNPSGFLIDPTGARRFWPLAVARCIADHGIDLQQLWAEVWLYEAEGEISWLTAGEEELHRVASSEHAAPSDIAFILEDLKQREESFNVGEYVHANAKDLCKHYFLKGGQRAYVDLNAGLEAAKYRGATVKGKRGYYVPPYESPLSAAQRAGLHLLKGGKNEQN